MNYIFNDTVLYCPEDGSIIRLDAECEQPVILSPILNRMLLLLVERQGALITREEFLEKVWDNYGRTGSSNTLNQYMGILRKIFADKLPVEMIITIPKQGYILSHDVVVQSYETSKITHSSDSINTSLINSDENETKRAEIISTKDIFKRISYIASLVLLVLMGIGPVFWLINDYETSFITTFDLTKIDTCPVYSFTDYTDQKHKDEAINKVNSIININSISCQSGSVFFFYNNSKVGHKNNGSYSILTKCSTKRSDDFGCSTYRTNRF